MKSKSPEFFLKRASAVLGDRGVLFLQTLGSLAASRGVSLYLVGGAARDTVRGVEPLDLDLFGSVPALPLSEIVRALWVQMPRATPPIANLDIHNNVGLCKFFFQSDIVPGVSRIDFIGIDSGFPSVVKLTEADEQRFPFMRHIGGAHCTVSALAVDLTPERFGRLYDPFGGLDDIETRLVRPLAENAGDLLQVLKVIELVVRTNFKLEATFRASIIERAQQRSLAHESSRRLFGRICDALKTKRWRILIDEVFELGLGPMLFPLDGPTLSRDARDRLDRISQVKEDELIPFGVHGVSPYLIVAIVGEDERSLSRIDTFYHLDGSFSGSMRLCAEFFKTR